MQVLNKYLSDEELLVFLNVNTLGWLTVKDNPDIYEVRIGAIPLWYSIICYCFPAVIIAVVIFPRINNIILYCALIAMLVILGIVILALVFMYNKSIATSVVILDRVAKKLHLLSEDIVVALEDIVSLGAVKSQLQRGRMLVNTSWGVR